MTPIPTRRPAARDPLDDDALAALVRAIADDWRMPPQRLDAADLARPRRRRPRTAPAWLVHPGRGPPSTAIVVTVAVAFAAVWLNAPRSAPGSPGRHQRRGPDRSLAGHVHIARADRVGLARSGAQRRPAGPGAGDASTPAGAIGIADLSDGTLGDVSIGVAYGTDGGLRPPGGGWLCICADWTSSSANGLDLTLDSAAADGTALAPTPLRSLRGVGRPVAGDGGPIKRWSTCTSAARPTAGTHSWAGPSAMARPAGRLASMSSTWRAARSWAAPRSRSPSRPVPAAMRPPASPRRSRWRRRAVRSWSPASGTSTIHRRRRHRAPTTGRLRSTVKPLSA